jgi:hypothetical protein
MKLRPVVLATAPAGLIPRVPPKALEILLGRESGQSPFLVAHAAPEE